VLRRDYNVTEAISLDGGGSSTLCLADPTPRVANIPVGINDAPGTLRLVGSNLAIFVPPVAPPPAVATRPQLADTPPATTRRAVWIAGACILLLTLLLAGALAARKKAPK
jgi:hypothetical protein